MLCDRYADSTLAYQGYGRGLNRRLLRSLNAEAMGGVAPDATLLLDVDAAVGLERTHGRAADRIGDEALSFHKKVNAGFRRIALSRGNRERVRMLDANRGMEAVFADALAALDPLVQAASQR